MIHVSPPILPRYKGPTLVLAGMAVLAMLSGGCQPAVPPAAKVSDFVPAKAPYTDAALVLSGTRLPVRLEVEQSGSEIVFFLKSKHGEVLEHEAYTVDASRFALWRAGGELYDPVIPLLTDPLKVGSKWEWKGQMRLAVDGKPAEGPTTSTPATAAVSLVNDQLNLRSGASEALRVDVLLKMDSGTAQPAERKLSFWFVAGKGMVKREFAASSTRISADEEAP